MNPDDASKPPCPRCGSQDARTVTTRWLDTRRATYRRRECQVCHGRYSTLEAVANLTPAPTLGGVGILTVTVSRSTNYSA